MRVPIAFVLSVMLSSTAAFANLPPDAPIINEPAIGNLINPEDVHMEAQEFFDPDPNDGHLCTDWEIWRVSPSERVWVTSCISGVERLHTQVFKAIHMDRQPLTTPGPITDWVVKQGVDRAKFSEIFNHADTLKKAQRAALLQDVYGVEGTPALGVAGRFYVPGQGPKTLTIANYLIGEARKG